MLHRVPLGYIQFHKDNEMYQVLSFCDTKLMDFWHMHCILYFFDKDEFTVCKDHCVEHHYVPLLSASVLDQLIHNEKKIPPEYTTAENFAEIQSLQQVTFLLTVCNVVLVVQDWFTDLSVLHFLQTAEMLKPSTPSSSGHDSSTAPDDHPDYYPHIVFVQNKSGREDFSVENFTAMQKTLSTIFQTSKLKMKGDVTMTTGRQTFGLNPAFVKSDLNLFVLPFMDGRKEAEDTVLTMLPEYRGYPSFQTLINSLRGQILAMPREAITHSTLTEKNWFHYAARIWDSIKKSQLIAEYNRLLP